MPTDGGCCEPLDNSSSNNDSTEKLDIYSLSPHLFSNGSDTHTHNLFWLAAKYTGELCNSDYYWLARNYFPTLRTQLEGSLVSGRETSFVGSFVENEAVRLLQWFNFSLIRVCNSTPAFLRFFLDFLALLIAASCLVLIRPPASGLVAAQCGN